MSRLLGIPVIAFSLIFVGLFWDMATQLPQDILHEEHAILFATVGMVILAGCAGVAGFTFGMYLFIKGLPKDW